MDIVVGIYCCEYDFKIFVIICLMIVIIKSWFFYVFFNFFEKIKIFGMFVFWVRELVWIKIIYKYYENKMLFIGDCWFK